MASRTEPADLSDSSRSYALDYEGPWVYSSLSIDGDGSPLHYWTGAYAVMEDFWTQNQLDQYASLHGASAVVALELEPDDADTFIAEIRRNAIDNSQMKSMLDDA